MSKNSRNIFITIVSILALAGATAYFTYHAILKEAGKPWLHIPEGTRCIIRINSNEFFGQNEISSSTILRQLGGYQGLGLAVNGLLRLDSVYRETPERYQGLLVNEILLSIYTSNNAWKALLMADASVGLNEKRWMELLESMGEVKENKADASFSVKMKNGQEFFGVFRNHMVGFVATKNELETLKASMGKYTNLKGYESARKQLSSKVSASIIIENNTLFKSLIRAGELPKPALLSKPGTAWSGFDVIMKRKELFISGYPGNPNDGAFSPAILEGESYSFPSMLPSGPSRIISLGQVSIHGLTQGTGDSIQAKPPEINLILTRLQENGSTTDIYILNPSDSIASQMISKLPMDDVEGLKAGIWSKIMTKQGINESKDSLALSIARLHDLLILGRSEEEVRKTMAAIRNRRVVSNSNWYQEFTDNMPDEAGFWGRFTIEMNSREETENNGSDLKESHAISWAIIQGKTPILSASITTAEPAVSPGQSPAVSTRTTGRITHRPYPVWDHQNQVYNVLVFDDLNTVSLFSPQGEILWDYQLDGLLMGDVQVVDAYKNNKYQYLFNTRQKIYLLDLNGNDVEGFPMSIPSGATNALVALDYDGRKDYRIILACEDKRIRNYDIKGKEVRGWKNPSMPATVEVPVQHIAMYGKDYIIIADKQGEVIMTDRRGDVRVRIKRSFKNAPQSPFFMQRIDGETRIITTDINGQIQALLRNGRVSTQRLENMQSGHRFTYEPFTSGRESDYIYLDGNELKVFNKDGKKVFETQTEANVTQGPAVLTQGTSRFLCIADSTRGEIFLYQDGIAEPYRVLKGNFVPIIIDLDQDLQSEILTAGDNQLFMKAFED